MDVGPTDRFLYTEPMIFRRLSLLLAAAATLAACVPAPEKKPEAPIKPADVTAPAADTENVENKDIKTDTTITTMLVNLIETKDKDKVDLTTAQGTPLGNILTVGSPIGYSLRNRYLNIGIPIAE